MRRLSPRRPGHLRPGLGHAVAAALLGGAFVVGLALPAGAHVTVVPEAAAKGSDAILSFAVPTEQETASTVKIEVTFPTDHPVASVSVQPKPGWSYTVDMATLAKPIKADSGPITTVVSKITWSGGEIKPGEFDLFTISAGPLPTNTKKLEFKVVQTYSNGQIVRWIEPAKKGAPEPEFPAPVLQLVGKA